MVSGGKPVECVASWRVASLSAATIDVQINSCVFCVAQIWLAAGYRQVCSFQCGSRNGLWNKRRVKTSTNRLQHVILLPKAGHLGWDWKG